MTRSPDDVGADAAEPFVRAAVEFAREAARSAGDHDEPLSLAAAYAEVAQANALTAMAIMSLPSARRRKVVAE